MFDLSLAETLRAASARLRALAGKATQSRKADYGWRYVEVDDMPPGQPSTTVTNCGWGGDDAVAQRVSWDDAAWIATMSPAVADPLAAELELRADAIDEIEGRGDDTPCVIAASAHLLTLARTILEQS